MALKQIVSRKSESRDVASCCKLCARELLVWIGIAIKMGTLGRCRAAHFWSNVDGFGDETIKGSMKKNRWKQIASNLSFAPRGTPPGWGKIKWFDEYL